jgi:hypothetical protein
MTSPPAEESKEEMPESIAPIRREETEDDGRRQNPKPAEQRRSKNGPPKQEREQRSEDGAKDEANPELESI